jgi:hypothetical protein
MNTRRGFAFIIQKMRTLKIDPFVIPGLPRKAKLRELGKSALYVTRRKPWSRRY